MRTSAWDILRLAWALYRAPWRKHQRIAQMLVNASGRIDTFYTENDKLIEGLRRF